MMRQTILVLTLATCVLAASLPMRRVAHSGPLRNFGRAHGRIVGGQDASPGQFPYQVSLQIVRLGIGSHYCGGSVISDSLVLSAGHCVYSGSGYYEAVAGEYDFSIDEGTEQRSRISEQIPHPDYQEVGTIAINDIAVYLLQSPFVLNDNVQVISLPSANSIPPAGSAAVLSGWGSIVPSQWFPEYPNILQYVDVVIVGNDDCIELVGNVVLDSNVCTGPTTGGISACFGDSGGPLTQDGVLIGVVSWGRLPCGTVGGPSVFARVSAFEDFINQYL